MERQRDSKTGRFIADNTQNMPRTQEEWLQFYDEYREMKAEHTALVLALDEVQSVLEKTPYDPSKLGITYAYAVKQIDEDRREHLLRRAEAEMSAQWRGGLLLILALTVIASFVVNVFQWVAAGGGK